MHMIAYDSKGNIQRRDHFPHIWLLQMIKMLDNKILLMGIWENADFHPQFVWLILDYPVERSLIKATKLAIQKAAHPGIPISKSQWTYIHKTKDKYTQKVIASFGMGS